MAEISGRNVNEVLINCCWRLTLEGKLQESRIGQVLSLPQPVIIRFNSPRERVLIWPERKANPFFHLMEGIWMMAGRNDAKWLSIFNPRMMEFCDDGVTLNGAYGHRWTKHWDMDQIQQVVSLIKKDPMTRRAVVTMWDPVVDSTDIYSSDLPCNTHIYFRSDGHRLDMTTCNRSNDLIWGLCGSNAVHFSMLHEIVAHSVGMLVGPWFHMTNNLHIYEEVPKRQLYTKPFLEQPYGLPASRGGCEANTHLCNYNWKTWSKDAEKFCSQEDPANEDYVEPWFRDVAVPMWHAFMKQDEKPLELCCADDWKLAGKIYLQTHPSRGIMVV